MRGELDRPAHGLTIDSRAVEPGWIFVALPGRRVDGHRFVPGLSQAAAVVVERDVEAPAGVTVLRFPNTRKALPHLAAAFHGFPGERVGVGGVTGTNGKTTVTFLAAAALDAAGRRCGVVGTTGNLSGGAGLDEEALAGRGVLAHHHTTPEAHLLQALLARMADEGCDDVLMEVSSIGLDAFRADAIPYRVAGYTNLTRDHLDYHGDMERYARAKQRLFHELLPADGLAVLNRDDPAWERFRPAHARTWTYGIERGDLRVAELHLGAGGTRARVHTPLGSGHLALPLVGRHNLSNGLCALGMALGLGAPLEAALAGLARSRGAPGRLEPVPHAAGARVFVDFAHTPDALERVLACLAELRGGRLLTVFGCGGDRDPGKRAPMGAAARAGSDLVFVTSDNPRSEPPLAIIEQILAGIPDAGRDAGVVVEPDRAAAIRLALREAGPEDIVLLAGKGHETTQELADRVIPFDDRVVARAILEEAP
ncbi:MAG: UDP-N-acetylmuramoyl-L-alanyl-D-glutamate--2,6-diaminopimelate ligase [Pseudomonadota bacterium]